MKDIAVNDRNITTETERSGASLDAFKNALRQVLDFGEDICRSGAFVLIRFASDWLPRSWADRLARTFGRLSGACPTLGRSMRRPFQSMFSLSYDEAVRVVNEYKARPYLDHIVLRRVGEGRDKLEDLPYVEKNAELIQELRESNQSYIVATGHFTREAMMRLHSKSVIPQTILTVAKKHTPSSLHPRNFWIWLHLGQMFKTHAAIHDDVRFVYPGNGGAWKRLIRALRRTGTAAVLAVDAPWRGKDGFTRKFCGIPEQRFSCGTARLARMVQRPIVLCTPWIDENGTVVVEWRRRFDPPAIKDESFDRVTTNAMLDEIEDAIARNPAQYVMGIV